MQALGGKHCTVSVFSDVLCRHQQGVGCTNVWWKVFYLKIAPVMSSHVD